MLCLGDSFFLTEPMNNITGNGFLFLNRNETDSALNALCTNGSKIRFYICGYPAKKDFLSGS